MRKVPQAAEQAHLLAGPCGAAGAASGGGAGKRPGGWGSGNGQGAWGGWTGPGAGRHRRLAVGIHADRNAAVKPYPPPAPILPDQPAGYGQDWGGGWCVWCDL